MKLFFVFVLACGWIFFGGTIGKAEAATTGAVYPSLGETISESPWSDNTWTTPTNVYSDDAATANVTASSYDSPDQTFVLKATGFDFSAIPDGSTINGVTVRMNSWYRSGTGSGSVDLCQLLNVSKAKVGTNNCSTPVALTTTNTTVITKGSSSDLWGNSLTATWVKDPNFGVAIGILATAANADVDVDYVTIEITYTPPIVSIPTVSTQAASSVESTTATGNGTIDATGGATVTRRGFAYMVGTSGDPTTADSVAYDDGSFGTGAYTKGLTGLSSGTSYRVRAYAVNSAGTGYGTTVQIITKPAAPTNVAATDGTLTDKVTITWTKSTGATDYHVWRDSTDLGSAGDVATFDDTGAGAPSITAGAAVASEGTSAVHVALSLSGASFNNGTTHTYKVVASNATGNSADSATNTGYRGYGTPAYQWQRSAGDSDASYSDITGATAATHNDTDAPADGSARYYKCILSSTGVSQQTSTADRGYKGVISITIETGSGTVTYGSVAVSEDTTASGVNQTQVVRNSGNVAEDFDIRSQHSADWTLGAAAGNGIYKHEWCTQTCDATPVWNALTTTYDSDYLATNVAPDATVSFDLKITVPTSNAGTNQQNVDVFVRAVQH